MFDKHIDKHLEYKIVQSKYMEGLLFGITVLTF